MATYANQSAAMPAGILDTASKFSVQAYDQLSKDPKSLLATVLFGASILFILHSALGTKNNIPMVNAPKFWQPNILVQLQFLFKAREFIAKGVATSKAFRILTDIGVLTILPSEFANEIRNHTSLSYPQVITEVRNEMNVDSRNKNCANSQTWVQNFHARFPGFEGFREGTTDAALSRDIARKHLTQSLGRSHCPTTRKSFHESDALVQTK